MKVNWLPSSIPSSPFSSVRNQTQFNFVLHFTQPYATGKFWSFQSLPKATKISPLNLVFKKHSSKPMIGLQPIFQPLLQVAKQTNILLKTLLPFESSSLHKLHLHCEARIASQQLTNRSFQLRIFNCKSPILGIRHHHSCFLAL